MNFGDKLRNLRKTREIGLRELSARLGYDRSYLSRIENGSVNPSADLVRSVAKFFKVPERELRVFAGMFPKDIASILTNYPEEAVSILRDAFGTYQPNGHGTAVDHRADVNQAVNSPFRYAGGKFYARNLILVHIPPHSTYIEPFVGGGSIFFAKPKVRVNWLNDVDLELMNCYTQIRDNPEGLIDVLHGLKASKELHFYYKNEFKWSNDLERAGRWYYLNRTSYSGIMNIKNCFWGYGDKYSMRPENWPANIRRTSKKLQGVKLTCEDFEKIIAEAPEGAFLFLDPPYFNADQDKFYTHAFEPCDHYRLQSALKKRKNEIKFLLTYDDSDEIRDLYGWTDRILSETWNYTINRTDDQTKRTTAKGKRYKGRELFIMNYEERDELPLFNRTMASLEGVTL